MGTIRHPNGQSKFSGLNNQTCGATVRMLFRELGRMSDFRSETTRLPSCGVIARVHEMIAGKPPYWSACTDYPNPNPATHMRTCMATFAPSYYGAGGVRQLATCDTFRRGYETALRGANPRDSQRLPGGYAPPECATINDLFATLTGAELQWAACANYDPAGVRDHLLGCVGDDPREFLSLRSCAAVRSVYELRLKASHAGLPKNYTMLSCDDAQAVLDKAVDYRAAQDAERRARAEAAEEARRAADARQRDRVREAREAILAQRQSRPGSIMRTCEPGLNKYPQHEYGGVLTALESSCQPAPSASVQLFMAGLGEELLRSCPRVPASAADRATIADFVASSVLVAVGGSQYNNPDLGKMVRDQLGSQAAYVAGGATFRSLEGCTDPRASGFADGLARYLKATASASLWVDGCELYYATRYSRKQCQCMAESLRAVSPAIHQSEFSRASIKDLIDRAPLQGARLLTCGISDY